MRIKQQRDRLENASAQNERNEAHDQSDWHGIYPKLWNQEKYHGQRCHCRQEREHGYPLDFRQSDKKKSKRLLEYGQGVPSDEEPDKGLWRYTSPLPVHQ